MTDTREKLYEAKYFLKCMKDKQSDRDAFKYNLSAFLSAARSVTLIMQKEFDKVVGFKDWYVDKQHHMESDNTMKLLNNKRIMTIHQQPIQPRAHVDVALHGVSNFSGSLSMVIIRADGTIERRESEPTPPPASTAQIRTDTTVEWRWYFYELPDEDVVTVCDEHIAKLESLVVECESLFTS
jgi:hypothetical protein